MPRIQLVMVPKISINGIVLQPADLDDLVDVRVEQSVSLPSQLTLRMSDPEFKVIDGNRFKIGAEITVAYQDPNDRWVTVFDGEIVTIGSEQDIERIDACDIVVTALDRAHRLGHTTRIRTFQQLKFSDIVSKIAGEQGLSADVTDTKVTYPYLIQTTTNYAYLNELAFRSGSEWRVEGKKLKFGPREAAAPAASVKYGEDIRRLKTRFNAADGATQIDVRSWDPSSKKEIIGTTSMQTVRAAPGNSGTAPLGDKGRQDAKPTNGTVSTSALIATSKAEADQLALALGARIATAELTMRCVCTGRPDVVAGQMVEITGAGTRLSGQYYVTSVEHFWGQKTDLTTTFQAGGQEPSSLVDLLGGTADRVEDFGRFGLTIGIVTNNKDPDGLGRVRVKFPQLSLQEESWWARVVMPGAGTDAGLMVMPQIDDEVLVGFEQGDLRRPYVLGAVWGPKARPPTASTVFLGTNQKVIEWGLKTAGGHTLVIRSGDQPPDKHFKVQLADGTKLYLGSDKTEVIAQNKTLELKSGQASVLLTERGDIEIRGVNITLKAQQNITIDGGVNVDVKGMNVKVDAKASVAASGAMAKVEASGIAEVKGSLVKIN